MSQRRLIHMRQVESLTFLRSDGAWQLEASLTDRKALTFHGGAGDLPAGVPIHAMTLACTMATAGDVLAAHAMMRNVPFETACRQVEANYSALVGLNLFRRFRAGVKKRLGDVAGCSHLSMLVEALPTLGFHASAGVTEPSQDDGARADRPVSFDRSGGLRTDGEAVRRCWPRWYRSSGEE